MDAMIKEKAAQKLKRFLLDPDIENLLSVKEFETLIPYHKGFCIYVQANWDESGLKHLKNNLYSEGSKEYEEFKNGSFAGMIWAQDSEE